MNKTQQKQAKEIEDLINEAREKINKECPGLLPYPCKVIFTGKAKE